MSMIPNPPTKYDAVIAIVMVLGVLLLAMIVSGNRL